MLVIFIMIRGLSLRRVGWGEGRMECMMGFACVAFCMDLYMGFAFAFAFAFCIRGFLVDNLI
jgi:hypothetical protein